MVRGRHVQLLSRCWDSFSLCPEALYKLQIFLSFSWELVRTQKHLETEKQVVKTLAKAFYRINDCIIKRILPGTVSGLANEDEKSRPGLNISTDILALDAFFSPDEFLHLRSCRSIKRHRLRERMMAMTVKNKGNENRHTARMLKNQQVNKHVKGKDSSFVTFTLTIKSKKQ